MAHPSNPTPPDLQGSPWRRRIKRVCLGLGLGTIVLSIGLWIAVHRVSWLGPWLAEALRSVIGAEAVTWIQETAYGLDDRWNRFWRENDEPKSHWQVPSAPRSTPPAPDLTEGPSAPAPSASAAIPELPPFSPQSVGPLYKWLAAEGDGQWVGVPDPVRPAAPPVQFKTLIHPDKRRVWAEIFVVAVDLRQVELHFIEGAVEPKTHVAEARSYPRRSLIPTEHHDVLLAAFNGGFRAVHGRWGLGIGDVTLIAPRKLGCTIGRRRDGALVIDHWEDLSNTDQLLWWRQGPPCMLRGGKRHGGLWDPDARGWGAAIGGDTVIRRSALGLNAARDVLYVAVSNFTTAQVLADGLSHIGAEDVVQLDVNWSYPKFILFPRDPSGQRVAKSLFKGFDVGEGDYLRDSAPRDFFYLIRKAPTPPGRD
ncbi:MAG: hypothetical protein DRI90_03275 [Deltaproteobacteria bacterium]|nr:MAG: hypothetical protein DRI90_03275 [Deltaproteobacteria bacterium]